jgi:protein-S-isoprenylcysteine O-methyltransferase Ste14
MLNGSFSPGGESTNPTHLCEVIGCLWAAFGLYWLVSAVGTHATKSGEVHAHRLLRIPILALTFILLLTPWLRTGVLGGRFIPESDGARDLGFALTLCGIAIAVWARSHLGRYWSDKVELKVDHKLIRSGPYTFMRHPIYSGVLLGVAGTMLAVGEWRGVLAFAILLTNYTVKAKKEERLLSTQFGREFEDYRRQSGFLIPRFRGRAM